TTNPQEQLDAVLKELEAKLQPLENQLGKKKQGNINHLLAQVDPVRMVFESQPYVNVLGLNLPATQAICVRLTKIFSQILADFSSKLDLRGCQFLCLQRRFINQLFEASGFNGLNALLEQFKSKANELQPANTQNMLRNEGTLRYLLLVPLGDIDSQTLIDLSLTDEELTSVITLGLLLDRSPLSVTGEANRKFLLEEFHPYKSLAPNSLYRHVVANVWMISSYCTGEKKHAIKPHLNEWFERTLSGKNIQPKLPAEKPPANKPTLVMVAESFKSRHAMFRWYGPLIKQMRADYEMVLLALPDDVDEEAKALFDRTIEVPKTELDLQPVFNACQPDIVYFPSVGMRAWAIALANVRWAPLQIMSLGHPASSFSKHIDVCLCGDRLFGGQKYFSENVVILDTEIGNNTATHAGLELPKPVELTQDEAHIAVPCHVMKLNFMFIAALKEIERLSEKPVRYTFFPNEAGVAHVSIVRRLKAFFPNCVVARRANYDQYLGLLNQHHLALSPFPFGNASSIIDCLLLNKPIVGLNGGEPHARSDYTVLGAFGLDEFLVADSIENYVLGTVRYLNEPGLLKELTDMVASKDVLNVQFQDDTARPNEIRRAISWAWQNKDSLRKTQATTFRSEGRW
ncbi:MAG: hypothetical protein R3194_05445, partial [Limnobacter sp.]|nr:hypothetical protein [Limnobacter sp.]